LRQHVHLRLELPVRLDRPRLRQHLPPLHLVLVDPPQQRPDFVPRLPLVPELAEHLPPPHHPPPPPVLPTPAPHLRPPPPPHRPPLSPPPAPPVPRPLMLKISSIGIKSGLTPARPGVGI